MQIHNIANHLSDSKVMQGVQKKEETGFRDFLQNSLEKVSQAELISNAYDRMIATGEIDNLHEAMIASQKAEITLNFALQVRKSVLDAYQELMRLQV